MTFKQGTNYAALFPTTPPGEKANAEVAGLMGELDALRVVAAKPLPPLPIGSEERQRESLRQIVWAMLMSSEFRFNH